MLDHYGREHGLRIARKHIGWYLQRSGRGAGTVKRWRQELCTSDDDRYVVRRLGEFYADAREMAA